MTVVPRLYGSYRMVYRVCKNTLRSLATEPVRKPVTITERILKIQMNNSFVNKPYSMDYISNVFSEPFDMVHMLPYNRPLLEDQSSSIKVHYRTRP